MPHEILYEYIGPNEGFSTLRLIWEPVSNHISLYFRTDREAVNGVVKPLDEMIEYFDRRALAGPPWNGWVARQARGQLAAVAGEEAPPDPIEPEDNHADLQKTG